MIDILPGRAFLVCQRVPKSMTSHLRRQFGHKICLASLDAQVRAHNLHGRSRSRVGHLPRPSGASAVTFVVVLTDSASESFRHKYGNLRRHLVKPDDCHIVSGGLPAPRFCRHITPGYEDRAVAIDAAREIGAEGFIHKNNYNDRPQCQRLGTPQPRKQLGAVLGRSLGAGSKGGDWDAWPSDLRVRQYPETQTQAAA